MRMPSRLAAAGVLAAGLVLAACGAASADANANGVVSNSPGVLSGNLIQVPVDADLNICGNSVDVVGLLNPAIGNTCANGEEMSGEHLGMWHHHWWHTTTMTRQPTRTAIDTSPVPPKDRAS